MSYWDISVMVSDLDLRSRVTACAAQETAGDPGTFVATHIWDLCASPGWSEAWASAVAAGNESPGRDAAVITDGMILAAVQGIPA